MNLHSLRRPLAWLLALQWLAVMLPVSASIALVASRALGFAGPETGAYVARSLAFCGAFTVIQALVGHRAAAFEGPATITVAVIVLALGRSSLTDPVAAVGGGLLFSAAALLLIAATGLMRPLARLYSSFVNAVFLISLGVNVGWAVFPGTLRASGQWPPSSLVLALAAVVGVFALAEFAIGGTVKSLSLLLAFGAGLAVFAVSGGLPAASGSGTMRLFLVRPVFEPEVVVSIALVAVPLALNSLGAVFAAERACNRKLGITSVRRGLSVSALSHAGQAILPGAATVPHAESAVVAARRPEIARDALVVAGVAMAALAVSPLGPVLLSRIPSALSNDMLIAVLVSLAVIGIRDLVRNTRGPIRCATAAGSIGVCTLLIPGPPAWLPSMLSYLVISPISYAMLIALVGEAAARHREEKVATETGGPPNLGSWRTRGVRGGRRR